MFSQSVPSSAQDAADLSKNFHQTIDVLGYAGFQANLSVDVVIAKGPIRRRRDAALEQPRREARQCLPAVPDDQSGTRLPGQQILADISIEIIALEDVDLPMKEARRLPCLRTPDSQRFRTHDNPDPSR